MQHIKEVNLVGKCFRHQCPLTKNLVKEKDYRCVDCYNAFRFQRPFWQENPTIKVYLKNKNKRLIEHETKRGHKIYKLVNA